MQTATTCPFPSYNYTMKESDESDKAKHKDIMPSPTRRTGQKY